MTFHDEQTPLARPQRLALIAAMSRQGVIGDGQGLLWHLPQDMAHFRATTRACPVIMGRKTWDSLPNAFRPLPGRRNIVITRQPQWSAKGAEAAHTLEQALNLAGTVPRAFVIGGGELYALALPLADELVLTVIDADFEGLTRFPAWDRQAFKLVERSHHVAEQGWGFTISSYRRAGSDDPTP